VLRAFGSDEYQGYLRSEPLPAAAFERLLQGPDAAPVGAHA
jgi:EAL domain-containing protein (putative c-di-GMP-specific phosphodiesterase class I)